jgi:hypothetical protein
MLDVVIKAAKEVGGIVKLAEQLGIKHLSFYSWDRVPAERVLQIAELAKVDPHSIAALLWRLRNSAPKTA